MLTPQMSRKLALGALTTAMFAANPGAFAHTSIEAPMTEGTKGYNSIVISHGCTTPSKQTLPIIAEVAVFPTDDITSKPLTLDDTTDLGTGNAKSPTAAIVGGNPLKLSDVISNAKGLAGLADLVQDRNVFSKQDELYDNPAAAKPNLIGFYNRSGKLQTNLRARVPFAFTPPTFKTTGAGACVNTLKIKIAVADICRARPHPMPGDANLWIPNANSVFTDKSVDGVDPTYAKTGTSGGENSGAPATLTINRAAPLSDVDCVAAGGDLSTRTVDVWPADSWVEQNLKIPGYWVPAP